MKLSLVGAGMSLTWINAAADPAVLDWIEVIDFIDTRTRL